MEKLLWFRTEFGIFVDKEIRNILKLYFEVHLAGGCHPVSAASGGHNNSLLPYLCLPKGRLKIDLDEPSS